MPRKNQRNTRGKTGAAAWKLFYEQGYENTTVEDIIFESETSKGTFYHYFEGKDALLETLSVLFDEKYQELMETMDEGMDAVSALEHLNWELFAMIDNSVPLELLSRLLSSQLITRGEKHLLDRRRVYFRLLRQIIMRGQERGEIRRDMSVNEISRAYAMWERALMYDWCLSGGEYSLSKYSATLTPMFLNGFREKKEKFFKGKIEV